MTSVGDCSRRVTERDALPDWGFPGGTNGEEPALAECRRWKRLRFDPWVGKIPWRRAWQPTRVFLPGKSHRLRSLVGWSPQCHKESDTIEASEHAPMLPDLRLFTGPRNKGDYTEQSASAGLSCSNKPLISGDLQHNCVFFYYVIGVILCWWWLCPYVYSFWDPGWKRRPHMEYSVPMTTEKQLSWCTHPKAHKASIRHNTHYISFHWLQQVI